MNHLKPTELYLGIESGIYDCHEAVTWADDYLAKHDYDDDIANVSLAVHKTRKEIERRQIVINGPCYRGLPDEFHLQTGRPRFIS